MLLEIGVFIAGVALLLFALFSIPALLQLRRTAEDISGTVQTLNRSMPTILKNLEDATTRISQTTLTVHQQMDGITYQVKRLQLTLAFLADLAQIFRGSVRFPLLNTMTNLNAGIRGIRAFFDVLNDRRPSRP